MKTYSNPHFNYKKAIIFLEAGATCVKIEQSDDDLVYKFQNSQKEKYYIFEKRHKFAENYIVKALQSQTFKRFRDLSIYKEKVPIDLLDDFSSDIPMPSEDPDIGKYDDIYTDTSSNDDIIETRNTNYSDHTHYNRDYIDLEVMKEEITEEIFDFKIDSYLIFVGIQPSHTGFHVTMANLKGVRKSFKINELSFEQTTILNIALASFIRRKEIDNES